VDDAEREPKIKKLGSPTDLPGILTCGGKAELIGLSEVRRPSDSGAGPGTS
jgi:hypothetical protein